MGFKKGNNLGGRTKGSVNKLSSELRSILSNLLEEQLEIIKSDLESLEPKDRLMVITKLLPYVMGKMKDEETDTSPDDRVKIIVDVQSNDSIESFLV